jgi:histone arginine demethylase JMJD6
MTTVAEPGQAKVNTFPKVAEVPLAHHPTWEEFRRDFAIPARPVLIKNAFPQWKAVNKWSPEFFKREHGHRDVTVAGETMTMAAFIDRVLTATPDNPAPYLRELCVRNFAPELGEDLTPFVDYALPNWLRGNYPSRDLDKKMNRASEVELFIGGAGTRLERRKADAGIGPGEGLGGGRIEGFMDLHFDPTACPVLLCQIYGQKEFWLFSPEDTPYLYATKRHSAVPNLDPPDFERFPLLKEATLYRFVQEPGDAVYVPPFWWHATRMRTISIAASSTFANDAHWAGVVEDVSNDLGSGSSAKTAAMKAWLTANGAYKKLRGSRLGESTHFQEGLNRKVYSFARAGIRNTLKRVRPSS